LFGAVAQAPFLRAIERGWHWAQHWLHIFANLYGSRIETFQGGKRGAHVCQPIDEVRSQRFYKAKMQVPRIALNDDAADHDVKLTENKVSVIWNQRLSYAHGRLTFADLHNETAYDLRLAHPFPGEEQIAEKRDASAAPLTAEVVGFDTAQIGRSLCGFHRLTSMLAEVPPHR
jgi:hypothetical protein